MKFKNLLVSEDNQLVLSDYGLSEDEVEVLDLNRSLSDIVNDVELQRFIIESSVDAQKIYIFCVKEDFGNNDQILEDIPNINVLGKAIKKLFKKLPNIYFFIYNIYLKNEDVINPTLDNIDAYEIEPEQVADYQENIEEMPYQEDTVYAEQLNEEQQPIELIQENEGMPYQEEVYIEEEFKPTNEDLQIEGDVVLSEQVNEQSTNEDLPFKDEVVLAQEINEPTNEDLPFKDEVVSSEDVENKKEEQTFDDSVTNFVSSDNNDGAEYVQDENELAIEAVEQAIDRFEEEPINEPAPVDLSTAIPAEELPTQENEFFQEEEQYAQTNDAVELEEIIEDGMEELISNNDGKVREYILDNTEIQAEAVEDAELFNEPGMLLDEIPITQTISDSVDSVAEQNNDNPVSLEEQTIVYDDGESSIEMPATFFDVEQEEEVSYEDYNEFVNDYELNIHALKSIYDFIWRILVLNNYNLKLNDLLYIAVNNLDAFSIGQSDFVRQTANKAESLFDLILQLDIKLEFNNSLFYIYLAEFFKISGNKIVVNEKFLDTISIWVNKTSKDKFISQIEQFMNYSTIYNKKIVFSYFIELANYVKGRLPSINSNISLLDVHRLINNQYNKIRKENIFGFMAKRINQILEANGVVVEMYLVKTPDSMFGIEVNQASGSASDSWKTQMAILYKKLIQNIHDYILLKGNKEIEIFNIFLDIRDLRIYQDIAEDRNILSPETISAVSNKADANFLTIGDELNRQDSIVPSQRQSSDIQYSYITPQNYVQNLEKGITMERKFGTPTETIVNNSNDNLTFPEQTTMTNEEMLREKYASKFNVAEFESSISRRIEEYERKIKNNISRIEAERKQLREKMEELKNI